jgi:methoxymalonate biosynthesis acyl carrier protein
MEIHEIMAALRGFIRERFGVPENDPDFTDEVDLFNYGYIDSFGAVELTGFIEKQFSVKFTNSDWVAFPLNTIAEISSFVSKRQKGEL